MTLLDISQLTLDLPDGTRLLDGVSLTVAAGETVGLVGESGSGKSLTARSVLGLLPAGAVTAGSVRLDGLSVLDATARQVLELRRSRASMIFQDPRAGINPMRTIGDHLTEGCGCASGCRTARRRPPRSPCSTPVGLPRPAGTCAQYPHELSGGMLQRVMIAGALAARRSCSSATSRPRRSTSPPRPRSSRCWPSSAPTAAWRMLFITHDLDLAASICDRVVVMNAGRVVERGRSAELFNAPRHPYTRGLLRVAPTLDGGDEAGGDPRGAAALSVWCSTAARSRSAAGDDDRCCRRAAGARAGGPGDSAACAGERG